MLDWIRSRRRKFKAKSYSLELKNFSREFLDAVYQEGGKTFVFKSELVGKKWEQINLRAPSNLTADSPAIFANLGEGLESLGYEYLIFTTGRGEPIPEHERQLALAGLREMGLQPEIAPDGSAVKLRKLPGWRRPDRFDAQKRAIQMTRLLRISRGMRTPEILAKSKAAVVDFV